MLPFLGKVCQPTTHNSEHAQNFCSAFISRPVTKIHQSFISKQWISSEFMFTFTLYTMYLRNGIKMCLLFSGSTKKHQYSLSTVARPCPKLLRTMKIRMPNQSLDLVLRPSTPEYLAVQRDEMFLIWTKSCFSIHTSRQLFSVTDYSLTIGKHGMSVVKTTKILFWGISDLSSHVKNILQPVTSTTHSQTQEFLTWHLSRQNQQFNDRF